MAMTHVLDSQCFGYTPGAETCRSKHQPRGNGECLQTEQTTDWRAPSSSLLLRHRSAVKMPLLPRIEHPRLLELAWGFWHYRPRAVRLGCRSGFD